jgi:hypothetical protein
MRQETFFRKNPEIIPNFLVFKLEFKNREKLNLKRENNELIL